MVKDSSGAPFFVDSPSMTATRRDFLLQSAAFALGVGGLKKLLSPSTAFAASASPAAVAGYGPLVPDPEGLFDLPKGFAYKIISRAGDEMDDGLLLPSEPDGMATFPAGEGRCVLMRNHELSPEQPSAFGKDNERLARVDASLLYDQGAGKTPSSGGVSTVVYNTKEQRVEKQFMRLGGTIRNCAGGPTPWGSWITCEEANDVPGKNPTKEFWCDQSHGYAFEAPASTEPGLVKAEPLRAMGRFRREAITIDPTTGAVYQTEDMDDGAFYRFLPNTPGKLAEGGRLQALAITGRPSLDTRNWEQSTVALGDSLRVEWIDLDTPDSPNDDLRHRAFDAGAARFARGEGIWWSHGEAYFACTSGGRAQLGQLFRFKPDSDGGRLELFLEPNDSSLVENADNLTAAPWGDLIVCEDRQGPQVRLVGVTDDGGFYTLANNHTGAELAGVCFSPDGSTLFVNIQHSGLTLAVTGPWRA